MTSAMDLIGHNPALQEHWLRRLIAIVVDGIVVFVVLFLFNALFVVFAWPLIWWSLFYGLIWILYSVILEAGWGATLGKRIVRLRVVGIEDPIRLNVGLPLRPASQGRPTPSTVSHPRRAVRLSAASPQPAGPRPPDAPTDGATLRRGGMPSRPPRGLGAEPSSPWYTARRSGRVSG